MLSRVMFVELKTTVSFKGAYRFSLLGFATKHVLLASVAFNFNFLHTKNTFYYFLIFPQLFRVFSYSTPRKQAGKPIEKVHRDAKVHYSTFSLFALIMAFPSTKTKGKPKT